MPDHLADYTAQALRTESPITPALQTRLHQHARLLHALLGLQTEAGELADPVKKHIYYGRPLDLVNLREEIGDCLWYLAIAADALGTTLAAEQARNLAKLRARYPHVFTAEAAQVRDLDREREVLEGNDLGTLLQQSQRVVSDAFSEVNCLRQQLEAAQQLTRDTRQQRDETVDKLNTANSQLVQLSALLHTANQHNLELVGQRDAARQTILAQKRGIQYLRLLIDKVRGIVGRDDAMSERLEQISQALDEFDHGTIEPTPSPEVERLRAFVGQVRAILDRAYDGREYEDIANALAELDAGTEPTPVAERCPECDGSGMVDSGGFGPDGKGINVPCGGDCRGNPCPSQPTPATEPAPCPECETTPQKLADANKQWQLVAQQREEDRKKLREYEQVIAQGNSAMDAARKKIAEQEAQVADLNDKLAARTVVGTQNLCREIERLQLAMNDSDERITNLVRFVETVRPLVNVPRRPLYPSDIDFVRAALAELDAGAEPTPVAEPLDAEGGK